MVSFNNVVSNNTSVSNSLVSTINKTNIVDTYTDLSEKKDEYVAVMLANDNKTDKRASATVIAANFSAMLAVIKSGIHFVRKGKAYKNPIIDWFMNGADYYINFIKKHKLSMGTAHTKMLGYCAYILGSSAIGGALGFALDWYSTAKNTMVNGKISNTKAGENGSWIQSGLKSLSATPTGKKIIKDSIYKKHNGDIVVKFNGIERAYIISKKELKDASHEYITIKNEDKTLVTGFKKKFSKGDGDVLAVEVAFEKYCKEVNAGLVNEDKNLPKSKFNFTEKGDVLTYNWDASQLYYLFTGKPAEKLSINNPNNDGIDNIYSKKGIKNYLENIKKYPHFYASEIMLHDNSSPIFKTYDKIRGVQTVKNDTKYIVENLNGKTVILANANKTKEKMIVPLKNVEKYISEVNYVDL